MERTALKKREKKRTKSNQHEDVEGEIPEAPTLEDFGITRSEEVYSEKKEELVELLFNSTTETIIYVNDTSEKVEASPLENDDFVDVDTKEDISFPEVLSDASSSVSMAEEAFAEPQQSAPLEEVDYHHLHLYPSLPLESALNSLSSLTWENIATPIHSASKTVKEVTLSFEIPLEILSTQLDSKIQHLYSNMILETSEEKVKEFLKENKTAYDGFELYELLCGYQRAYIQLSGCEKVLSDLRERCTTLEKSLWTVEHETLNQSSTCVDGNVVSATHKFLVAKFDNSAYTQLDKVLKGTKELVKDSFSLFTYSVELCKAQINNFFHKSFKDINLQSFEVQGYYSGYPTGELQDCANLLKICISILFIFIRRSSTHIQVLRDCQKWVKDCVGLLLRVATLDDHLFILNHVIRCPPGMIGKGLAACVQVPKIPIPSNPEEYNAAGFSNLNLDYALTLLKIILNPVSQREDFLTQVEVGIKAVVQADPSNQWVVVDSDGEDDPEDVSFFKESDLISLLHQIPFDNLFRRILLISKEQGEDLYDIQSASERNVLKLLAFGTQLTSILGQGFVSYYTDRYRQLVKMIGRLILHTAQYITDHIESLKSSEIAEESSQTGSFVRKEYDLFFRNAVGVLFSGKNIGTLQFLAAMPYHLISSEMLWHVYCAITKWAVNDRTQTDISTEFEHELVSMNESDAFYLLTTLCNMATAREARDSNFTRIVTLHLFQIGFLSPLTRDSCSKNARDLLGNLTRKYPEIISVLLHTINSKMKVLETFSLYLLKELAFDLWKPSNLDMTLVFHWLVKFQVSSIENQTARFVIQSMNWGFDYNGELFLPFEIHYKVALMIMESNSKWEKGQNFISEGMKQINPMSNRTQDNWAWDLLKRLHLHAYDRQSSCSWMFSKVLNNMPTFDSNSELECIRKGVESKSPLACFLSLFLTPVGHSVPLICSKGIDLVEIILQNYRLDFVATCLFFITPLFVDSPDALYSIDKFRNILSVLLAADMTYMRMAKNLILTDFPGDITKLLGDMISCQINQCSRIGTDEKHIIALWTESLTKLDGWNKDQNVLYLLDVLAKASVTREDCHSYFFQFFTEMYKNMPQSSHSGIASIFSWTTPITSLLPNPPYGQMPYFIYYILSIEMNLENQSGFWRMLCIKLNNPKTSLDAAVKKCSNSTKFATSINFLTIYRWAQLALDLPNSHELTFLIWQKFFLRYFHRVSGNQTTQYSCVASRFFEGMVNTSFYNKLRRKLNDLLSFWREKQSSFERKDENLENASENPIVVKEKLTDKINLTSAFVLWIEDIQLLQPTLYLPALAPHFLPTVLLSLMDGEEISWNNYVEFDAITNEESISARTYMVTICRSGWFDRFKPQRFADLRISSSNCAEDVLKRLNSYDAPTEPPPVPVFEDIIPASSPVMLVDVKRMKQGLDPHWKQLKQYSKSFTMQISHLLALNCGYWESLPELYTNSPAEMLVNARCSGKNGGRHWENCSGAAHVLFKYTETKLNEGLGHQVHQNRTDYQGLLDDKCTKPPPTIVCIAAVYIEDFITNLVMHYRRASLDGEERIQVSIVGSELFYHAATLVNDDTDFYPPTRQLLSSLLEVLGREFIATLPNQSHRLVTTAIRSPKLVGSLAPHLNLATCQPTMLIDIYREVSSIPKRNVDLTFVMLTKFDINNWLKNTKPKYNERSQLIQIMWKAISADGFSPPDERLMVHDTYRNHLRNMLVFDFPQHYGEILTLLLDGIGQSEISPQILYDFCNCLSRDTVRFSGGMEPSLRKREVKRFATEGSILEHQELIETAHLLARHFTGERLANGLYGLYSKFRNYVEAISCFIQMISYGIVAYSLKNSKGILSQHIVDAVWPIIRDLYAPWILPYNQKFVQQNFSQWIQHANFDAANILQPWISNDSQFAMVIVNDFTDCLMFLVETLPGNSTIFSYLWNYYVENFALIGVKEHVVGVVHNCFVSIPWAMYWPTFADVELMCKVVEKFLPASHSFLSIVFAQISWSQWIASINPKFTVKGHAMLLNLTIRLGNDSVARESPTWMHVMETAETRMNWLTISPSALEPILNWLVMSIDPRVVLNLEVTHRMDKALLRLLETACGYGHPEQLASNSSCNSLEINSKRYCFVRSYARLIVSASSKHKNLLEVQPKAFEDTIKNMVVELANSVKRENQSSDFFISHLRELLSLMSNHTLGTIARNAMLEWCNNKDCHSLVFLMAVIQLSCSVKVKPYIVCPLIETVINLCFQYPDATWMSIRELTVVNPEELSNFFDVASKDGHYLVLNSLLLRRFTSLIEGGFDSICFFMDLLKNIKPKESNEEAVSLIYEQIIKVTVQLHIEASHGATDQLVLKHGKKFLLSLAQHLSLIGDDKQGWGLLGALGIGKASQLSIRGRLFAKCLATFVFVQLPIGCGVRIDPGSVGHFVQEYTESPIKPHPEVQSCLEKLESLKQNRQHTDLIECIDFATDFIKDSNTALSSCELFISKLNGYLFSARFLIRS